MRLALCIDDDVFRERMECKFEKLTMFVNGRYLML